MWKVTIENLSLSALPEMFHKDVTKRWHVQYWWVNGSLWSGSKKVINFPWQSLQRSRENYFQNCGVSLRVTNRQKKILPSKNTVSLTWNVGFLSQEPSDSCILNFNVIFHGKLDEQYINRQLVMCECCGNWNRWSFGNPLLHYPKWIQCDLLKPITLSLSSHITHGVTEKTRKQVKWISARIYSGSV